MNERVEAIWPAKVEDIATPPPGTRPAPISGATEALDGYMTNYKERMLKDKLEIC